MSIPDDPRNLPMIHMTVVHDGQEGQEGQVVGYPLVYRGGRYCVVNLIEVLDGYRGDTQWWYWLVCYETGRHLLNLGRSVPLEVAVRRARLGLATALLPGFPPALLSPTINTPRTPEEKAIWCLARLLE